MKNEIPYIRVGTDYFKVIKKEDRYSGTNIILKGWKKDEIKEDHTKTILSKIYKSIKVPSVLSLTNKK